MTSAKAMRRNGHCPANGIIFAAAVVIFAVFSTPARNAVASSEAKHSKNYREARMLEASASRSQSTRPDKMMMGGGDADARVDCRVDGMFLIMNLGGEKSFTGRVYPKGFSKTPCAQVYSNNGSRITYEVPMNTCNTMVNDFENGTREYHNMIVVQHHQALVTKQDRSYAVRCRYRASEQLLQASVGVDNMEVDPVEATAPAPVVEMLLLADASRQAEFVNIGDPLTLQLQIPAQRMYGILVRSCVVRDGAGVGGLQSLYDERGCPIEPDIMGPLQYKDDLTRASVTFKAHKFPYTTSLYYECHVEFCLKPTGECDRLPTPPKCDKLNSAFGSSSASSASSSSPAIGSVLPTNGLNDDDNISHLLPDAEMTNNVLSTANQTPVSTTAYTTIKIQPSTTTTKNRQSLSDNMRRGDPSRVPIKDNDKDELMLSVKNQPQPSVAVEDMLIPSAAASEQQVVEKPDSKKPSSSFALSINMKQPQIVIEEHQIKTQPMEPVSSSSATPSTGITTTTTPRPVATTSTGRVFSTTKITASPLLRSRSLAAEQQSRMLLLEDAENQTQEEKPVHEVIGFSSESPTTATTSSPPATSTERVATGYAAVEPLTSSDMASGRQVYARKARSISFATMSPGNEIDTDDDENAVFYKELYRKQQKRKLEASLGGEVIEFVPKSSAATTHSYSWADPHVETLIGYYDGARDDDFDLIRTRRETVSNNSYHHRVRRSSSSGGSLTSSSSSIEVGRTAREAKVVRGLNVIDVSEPVSNYLMQAYKSQDGVEQQPVDNTTGDIWTLPSSKLCVTTTTFAIGSAVAGVLCLLSMIVLSVAACSHCRRGRRRDDESDMLGSECAAATAVKEYANGELVSGHLANLYSNAALLAAAGYPTLTHGATGNYSVATLTHSPSPPAMSSVSDSPIYRYSTYQPSGQYVFQ